MDDLRALREQVALMVEIRDRVRDLPSDDAKKWVAALVPLTDELLRRLYVAERTLCPRPAGRTVWPTTDPEAFEIGRAHV